MQIINGLFKEICKNATMEATSALSKFLNTPIKLDMKPVELIHVDEVSVIPEKNDMVVCVFSEIKGKIHGASYFLWHQNEAHFMCEILYHHKTAIATSKFREEEMSALSEISNIVTGNFLTSFASSLKIDSLLHAYPHFDCDTYETIQNKWLNKAVNDATQLVIEISFAIQHIMVKGYVLIILEEDHVKKVLNELSLDSNM